MPRRSQERLTGKLRSFPTMWPPAIRSKSTSRTARAAYRNRVVSTILSTGTGLPSETPLADSVIYEMHVKGFSFRNPDIPEEPSRHLRRPRASLQASTYLRISGITAVELLPIHHFIDEGHLVEKGLTRLLGIQHAGLFCADVALLLLRETRGGQVREFKEMVKALHAAGIEVILDVVYNHTCEGNHLGPMLSWKGIDNATYYRLMRGRTAVLTWTIRDRQFAERAQSASAEDDHGFAALLGNAHARGRIPLRPGGYAGARTARREQAVVVLRHHSPGPDTGRSEADCRAVGRGRRRIPGGAVPCSCGRSGTGNIATLCAGSGRATQDSYQISRIGLRDQAICTSSTGASLTQASISLPRMMDSRCVTW